MTAAFRFLTVISLLLLSVSLSQAWLTPVSIFVPSCRRCTHPRLLSDAFLENDLVAIAVDDRQPRLCAVRYDGTVAPLCLRGDDVETDAFVDPREYTSTFWTNEVTDECVKGTYGEGFFGQRPVPSLGGGPGYGAEADDCWSIDQEVLEKVKEDGVLLPTLDIGISHGEKARAGAF